MSKIPPRQRKTAYSSLRRICERLGLYLGVRKPDGARPFLVDREGVVYPPTRRVVLKAKS